ncbi:MULTISPECIES: type VII secretion protein EccB [Streptomyces]|uniref:type VII secretion protein EccB n=1 Tax=Streptomyces TaxID=1883 RepID=UPI0018DF2602|nr:MULTISPECIES: type VII secretion protein EccB [Streptomyces]MCZ4101423.1 type VII secretion protein EccB [Streptomyces sp. H39-C1]
MQSRRDQVQAHMFVVGRLTSGMLRADPDAPESPVGRTMRGLGVGIAVSLLLSVGFGLYGMLSPGGGQSFGDGRSLIVEKETGNRYLLIEGTLRPVTDYASVRLILGEQPKVRTVTVRSLSGLPHGLPMGIAGAPGALPAPGDLNQGMWFVCATTVADPSGTPLARTSLRIGTPRSGPDPVAAGRDPGDQALLVSAPDGARYVLWRNQRLRLDTAHGAAQALGYASAPARPVSGAFLDSVPAGPDLTAPEISGGGTSGRSLGGAATRVGQVFLVRPPGGQEQYYLMTTGGLRPVSATVAALVLGDPRTTQHAYAGRPATALPLGADQLAGAVPPATGGTTVPSASDGLPAVPPRLLAPADGDGLCVTVLPDGANPRVGLTVVPDARAAVTTVAVPTGLGTAPACLPVDQVSVSAGGGALVQALGAGGGSIGSTAYLVTDTGVKYRLASKATAKALGYDGTAAQGVPSRLLAMLPTGPTLDPAVAARTVTAPPLSTGCRG